MYFKFELVRLVNQLVALLSSFSRDSLLLFALGVAFLSGLSRVFARDNGADGLFGRVVIGRLLLAKFGLGPVLA